MRDINICRKCPYFEDNGTEICCKVRRFFTAPPHYTYHLRYAPGFLKRDSDENGIKKYCNFRIPVFCFLAAEQAKPFEEIKEFSVKRDLDVCIKCEKMLCYKKNKKIQGQFKDKFLGNGWHCKEDEKGEYNYADGFVFVDKSEIEKVDLNEYDLFYHSTAPHYPALKKDDFPELPLCNGCPFEFEQHIYHWAKIGETDTGQ